jgi:hypothetical protein
MLCSRCLHLDDLCTANFCPACGRSLQARRSSAPTVAELAAWKDQALGLLPKLQAMRRSLEHEHKAMEARLNLIARRLRFTVNAEEALSVHLRDVCQRISKPTPTTVKGKCR